jgi:hypothetical protein
MGEVVRDAGKGCGWECPQKRQDAQRYDKKGNPNKVSIC